MNRMPLSGPYGMAKTLGFSFKGQITADDYDHGA